MSTSSECQASISAATGWGNFRKCDGNRMLYRNTQPCISPTFWNNETSSCENPADDCPSTKIFNPSFEAPNHCRDRPSNDPDGDMDGDGTPNRDDDDVNGNGQKNTCDPSETICILDACDTCNNFEKNCSTSDCSAPEDQYPEGGRNRDQDGNIWETKSTHCRADVSPPRCYSKRERTGWQDPSEPIDNSGTGTGGTGDSGGTGGDGTGQQPDQPITEQSPNEKKNSWSDKEEFNVRETNSYDPTTNTQTTTEVKREIDSAGRETIITEKTKKQADGSTTTTTTKTRKELNGTTTTTTTETEKDATGQVTGQAITGEEKDQSGTKEGMSDKDRDGKGSASGGDGCDTPPTVKGGDPLLAMQIKQQWLTRCKGSGDLAPRKEFTGYESLEPEVNAAKQAYSDAIAQISNEAGQLFGSFQTGGGSLPAFTFSFAGKSQTVNMGGWGSNLINFGTILLFAATVFAVVIVMRK